MPRKGEIMGENEEAIEGEISTYTLHARKLQ